MASLSLYRRVLGERFDTLPYVLKRFHGASDKSDARGIFLITRGAGIIAKSGGDDVGNAQCRG